MRFVCFFHRDRKKRRLEFGQTESLPPLPDFPESDGDGDSDDTLTVQQGEPNRAPVPVNFMSQVISAIPRQTQSEATQEASKFNLHPSCSVFFFSCSVNNADELDVAFNEGTPSSSVSSSQLSCSSQSNGMCEITSYVI